MDTSCTNLQVEVERSCELISADGLHPPIQLSDGKPLIIGRGPLTTITNKKCSRNQVEVTADFEKEEVTVRVLGPNPIRVGQQSVMKGEQYVLGSGGSFELICGSYKLYVHYAKNLSQRTKEELEKVGVDPHPNARESDGSIESDGDCAVDVTRGGECCGDDVSCELMDADARECARAVKAPRLSSDDDHQGVVPFPQAAPSSQGEPLEGPAGMRTCQWAESESLMVFQCGAEVISTKVAGFDLDNTVIKTASGKRFPVGTDDWRIDKNVVCRLQQLHKENAKIVIFSNQAGIADSALERASFRQKIEAMAALVQVPFLLLASIERDIYRKPNTGMWDYMQAHCNGGASVNAAESFYVGDAAGREAGWKAGAKKDFSCSDRKFAANIGVTFYTPEEYFEGSRRCSKFSWGEFDPRALDYGSKRLLSAGATICSESQEVVVFVGCPASGKSTFARTYMPDYHIVNRDTLGSWQKCVVECKTALNAGKSVAVDNTNPDPESRQRYIQCAVQFGVGARCFHFTTSVAHARHNNRFRELTEGQSDHGSVGEIAFRRFRSRFEEPQLGEGFSSIVKIDFVPHFANGVLESLYRRFLDE